MKGQRRCGMIYCRVFFGGSYDRSMNSDSLQQTFYVLNSAGFGRKIFQNRLSHGNQQLNSSGFHGLAQRDVTIVPFPNPHTILTPAWLPHSCECLSDIADDMEPREKLRRVAFGSLKSGNPPSQFRHLNPIPTKSENPPQMPKN